MAYRGQKPFKNGRPRKCREHQYGEQFDALGHKQTYRICKVCGAWEALHKPRSNKEKVASD